MTFKEKQRFSQWWLWAILLSLVFVGSLGVYQQIIKEQPFGDNPMSDSGLIIFALCMYALPLLFLWIHLKTEINREKIKFNFVPFLSKSVEWSEVKSAIVLDYGFVGGWGIYQSSEHGTVYATGGRKGLAITTKNGRKFVIGTQKEAELKTFLQEGGFL